MVVHLQALQLHITLVLARVIGYTPVVAILNVTSFVDPVGTKALWARSLVQVTVVTLYMEGNGSYKRWMTRVTVRAQVQFRLALGFG